MKRRSTKKEPPGPSSTQSDARQVKETSELFRAIDYGRTTALNEMCLKGYDLEVRDKNGFTPLIYATFLGRKESVRCLCKWRVNVDAVDDKNRTALHYACMKNHPEIVRILIFCQANVNCQDYEKMTPLHCAVHHGHMKVVKVLLIAEASLALKNKYGVTPEKMANETPTCGKIESVLHEEKRKRSKSFLRKLFSRSEDSRQKSAACTIYDIMEWKRDYQDETTCQYEEINDMNKYENTAGYLELKTESGWSESEESLTINHTSETLAKVLAVTYPDSTLEKGPTQLPQRNVTQSSTIVPTNAVMSTAIARIQVQKSVPVVTDGPFRSPRPTVVAAATAARSALPQSTSQLSKPLETSETTLKKATTHDEIFVRTPRAIRKATLEVETAHDVAETSRKGVKQLLTSQQDLILHPSQSQQPAPQNIAESSTILHSPHSSKKSPLTPRKTATSVTAATNIAHIPSSSPRSKIDPPLSSFGDQGINQAQHRPKLPPKPRALESTEAQPLARTTLPHRKTEPRLSSTNQTQLVYEDRPSLRPESGLIRSTSTPELIEKPSTDVNYLIRAAQRWYKISNVNRTSTLILRNILEDIHCQTLSRARSENQPVVDTSQYSLASYFSTEGLNEEGSYLNTALRILNANPDARENINPEASRESEGEYDTVCAENIYEYLK